MVAALRVEPDPLDDVTRARWLARLSPHLDELAGRPRRTMPRGLAWFAVGALAASAAAIAWWPERRAVVVEAVDRERLRPYVVAGASSDTAATTLLAGRFSAIDVAPGELVRAAIDDDRIALVGPAHVEVTAANTDLAISGTVVVEARSSPLVVHAGRTTIRAYAASFVVAASTTATVVFVERGEIELDARRLHAGEWSGPAAERSEALIAALHDHVGGVAAPGDHGGVVAIEGDAPVATEAGAVIGTAPLWARLPPGKTVLVFAGPAARHVAIEVRAGEIVRVPGEPALPAPSGSAVIAPSRPAVAERHRATGTPPPAESSSVPLVVPAPATATTGVTASAMYASAEAELGRGDRDAAEQIWTELLAQFPDAPQAASAHFDLAGLARARGDLARAQVHLTQLLAGSPPAALAEPAHYLSCRLRVEAGDLDAAVRCFTAFRASFARSTHDAEALAWLAGRAYEVGGCAAANALLAEYLRRYPQGSFAASARACEARP